jgi:hypothetical protein
MASGRAGLTTVIGMEASHRQPGMLEGLSRFLVQHERCGAGFDVAHPAGLGSGRVSITCRGCGARHEYTTATLGLESDAPAAPAPSEAPRDPGRRRIPPRPAPYPDAAPKELPEREAEGMADRTGLPETVPGAGGADHEAAVVRRPDRESEDGDFWGSPRTTIALLAVAAVALVIAVIALLSDDNGNEVSPAPTQPPAASAPSRAGGPAAATAPNPPTVTLRTSLFSVELPNGWTRRSAGGSLLLEPPGSGRANVQIYYQASPTLSEAAMGRKTARFLRREVPGASLYPQRTEIDGQEVQEYTARGPGETAIAVNVLRGPYRYLLVRRIFAGAKPHVSLAGGRIVRSFRLN